VNLALANTSSAFVNDSSSNNHCSSLVDVAASTFTTHSNSVAISSCWPTSTSVSYASHVDGHGTVVANNGNMTSEEMSIPLSLVEGLSLSSLIPSPVVQAAVFPHSECSVLSVKSTSTVCTRHTIITPFMLGCVLIPDVI
jgi:hypothetical protein